MAHKTGETHKPPKVKGIPLVWGFMALFLLLGLSAIILGVLLGDNTFAAPVRYRPTRSLTELQPLVPSIKAEKGVVYAAGGTVYLSLALRSVYWLRHFGYQGPITFVVADTDEIPQPVHQQTMTELKVDFINAQDEFYRRGVTPPNLRGYQLKPFAMLLSGYQKAILLDADTLPLCNLPEKLFATGKDVLFWPDVVKNQNDQWFSTDIWDFMGMTRLTDEWQQESSCVLMNRATHLQALLRICQMNYEYGQVYKLIHGDKDTWRIGTSLENLPYEMVSQRPGAISNMGKNFVQYLPDGTWGYIQGEGLRTAVTPNSIDKLRLVPTADWVAKHGRSELDNEWEEYEPLPEVMRQVLLR